MNSSSNHSQPSTETLLWYLKNCNIFENFSRDALEAVAELLRPEDFERGEIIILPYTKQRRIYFLMKGKVKLIQYAMEGKEIILAILGEGELFGLLAPLQEKYSKCSVVALENCVVSFMNDRDFFSLMQDRPRLCLQINKYIGERLIRIENRMEELLFKDIPHRLGCLLLRLAKEHPLRKDCGVQIDLRLTQEEIGGLIGATRESTNAALNHFKRNGWIQFHERTICLHDERALKKLVE